MLDETTLAPLVQFGVAGLMAWMWTSERRAGADRERQLTESHDRLMEQRTQLEALMKLVTENTRAITSLDAALRAWIGSPRLSVPAQEPPAARERAA